MNALKQRAANAMIGLAIGDAVSWTSMFHRSYLLPLWTRRIRREMDAASENDNLILHPLPFSLNQPPEYFNISPTSSTEWAAFSAGILLRNISTDYSKSVLEEWIKLLNSDSPVRGAVSTQSALNNLKNGLLPPQTGKENPHYFDDSAMPRSVPIGIICAGEPGKAVHMSEIDAGITNSEDGIWAAQAMAAAISLACSGKNISEVIKLSYDYLPESSWIRRIAGEALEITASGKSIFSIFPELHNKIVNREYSYGNAAPETMALMFSIVEMHGNDFEKALTTACCFAKSSETLPAMVGALSGALNAEPIASENWMESLKFLKGISIPSLSGFDYLELVEKLSNSAGEYL
jgi:ADP-ribosylglycohydrolase